MFVVSVHKHQGSKNNTVIMDMFPSAAAAAAAAASDDGKMVDLTDKIEKSGCYARNEASGFPMSNLFIGDSRLGCKSDTDEQLIIHIEFQEFVKVTSKMETSCAVTCFLLSTVKYATSARTCNACYERN